MTNFLDLFGIGEAIVQAIRTFFGFISATLYEFISTLYEVFIFISKAQILDNEYINAIYRKVGFILSLFMIFKLSFSLIQSLVDPDKLTDSKTGVISIIKRSIIAIVLLGITPTIFKEAFEVQDLLVGNSNRDNIIYKFIVNKSTPGNFDTLGRRLAADLYFDFFTDNEDPKMSNSRLNLGSDADVANRFPENDLDTLKKYVEEGDPNNKISSFHDTVSYLTIKDSSTDEYVIEYEYQWLFSIGFGIVCVWFFVLYCIQVGIRVIQLGYLQLIAPIPILSYISDPEGSFKRWIKQCTTTYLDLFIRLAIIYFTMTLVGEVMEQFSSAKGLVMETTGIGEASSAVRTMVKVFIIIGLLMFAKKVPELIKDLFPNLGGGAAGFDFGLKSPKKALGDIPGSGLVKGAATFGTGVAVGGIAGMASGIRNGYGVRGKIAGAFGGLKHGIGSAKTKGNIFKNAQSGMSNTRQARQRALDRRVYKIDNSKLMKDFQRNEDIIAAKKAIDDRAESEILKTNDAMQEAKIYLDYLEQNVGKMDTHGVIITEKDVVTARQIYKKDMDLAKETWTNANTNDKEVAKQMQIIQNKTGKTISTYADVDRENNIAKTNNATNVRKMQENEAEKEKIQKKKGKIK